MGFSGCDLEAAKGDVPDDVRATQDVIRFFHNVLKGNLLVSGPVNNLDIGIFRELLGSLDGLDVRDIFPERS